MKLSMYMIEYRLSAFHPVSTIHSAERNITNARLFTDDLIPEADCIYVGRNKDFFSDSCSDEILLMHKKDVISLNSTDLNKVFNAVLGIFDFFNSIEERMLHAFQSEHPEQDILSCVQNLIGPTFIITTDYRLLAISKNYSARYVNEFWDNMAENELIDAGSVFRMKDSNCVRLMKHNPNGLCFTEPKALPFKYGIMYTYRDLAGKVLGYLIMSSDKELTPFELSIAEWIITILNFFQQQKGKYIGIFLQDRY